MARYHAHGPQAFGCGPLRSIVRGRENEPVSLYAGGLTLSSWSELHGSAIQPASDVMYRPIPRDGTTDQERGPGTRIARPLRDAAVGRSTRVRMPSKSGLDRPRRWSDRRYRSNKNSIVGLVLRRVYR